MCCFRRADPSGLSFAGAVIAYNAGVNRAVGIFTCWFALFSPGIILIYGVMPWWGSFRSFQVYRR
jgi:chromate transporter